jgi:hypothetical protein
MILVKDIIRSNLDKYKDFEAYLATIEIIESNVDSNPDISVESCKSLIEGISKMFLKYIDKSYSYEDVEGMEFLKRFKKSMGVLSSVCSELETDFVNKACVLMQALGELRNKRGDISHGRVSPKLVSSSSQFSKLVIQSTEVLAFYLLEQFYRADLSDRIKIEYNDNPEFNIWLDEINPLNGVSFSKALFEQDNVAYCEQLEDYKIQKLED